MTAPDRIAQTLIKKNPCQPGAFSNRVSFVNGFFVAAPGHGSLRGRNNPPQHLVRSTGAAMSTTSWRTMTPLKAHLRSHPYPRPAGNHHIRDFARMDLTNYGVRRRLRAPTSGTASEDCASALCVERSSRRDRVPRGQNRWWRRTASQVEWRPRRANVGNGPVRYYGPTAPNNGINELG
jgi:hypothetical protein